MREYISTLVRTAVNCSLGRTQIVLTKKDLEIVESMYHFDKKLVERTVKGKNRLFVEYHVKGTNVFLK
jgi:hypothetical protein